MSHIGLYDSFQSRARTLEAVFFQKRDAELLANLRSELAALEEEHKLTHVSGILDKTVLLDLIRVGVTAESLLAMRLAPMVAVAWADRSVSDQERQAILTAAAAEHITPGSAAHQLLAQWLDQPPAREVITAWKEYVGALAKAMPPESLQELRKRTETLCDRVARASGGILGFGRISIAEQAVIQEFVGSWSNS